jgi:dipeptidase
MGCDTFVALPPATRDGVTLFGKNSDRPPRECQRIVQLPRRRGRPDGRVRCQYLEIPDIAETAAVVGSQPYWLWGFEHGVNEHRVAIGNETVYCKEPLGSSGLTGMDVVRLGLERGRTATEALEVMTSLLETHGQGGSGHVHLDWPYHNAFLVADPTSAWVLETSARHWVAKPATDAANISNGLAIGTEWTRGHADVTAFAAGQGWWDAQDGRVDFARAYNDDTTVPPNVCVERRRRGAALLVETQGQATAGSFRAMLRDHYDGGPVHRARDFADPFYFSICMHADPLDNTTASMVMELPRDPSALVRGWVSLGSPCVGAFLPCYPQATIPARLGVGGAEPSPDSPWWSMRELLTLVERDVGRFGPEVRARWDAFEATLVAEAVDVEATARQARDPVSVLTAFMERGVDRYLAEADALRRDLEHRP